MSPAADWERHCACDFRGVGTAVQLMTDGQLSQLELVVDRRESGTRDRGRAFYADVDIGAFAGRAGRARTEQKDAVGTCRRITEAANLAASAGFRIARM